MIAGEQAAVTGANSSFTASLVLTSAAKEGMVTHLVTAFKDEVGNEGGGAACDHTVRSPPPRKRTT